MTPRPPLSQKIIYALGQLGWSLAAFGAANLMFYFYMPSEDGGEALFPTYIYQGAILGILTVIGILNSGGRIFDGITDPLIANWSDKSTYNFGKRKTIMAIAALPFAIFSYLIFFPISDQIFTNGLWLGTSVFLFYLFMTMYVVPYTALISELGHHSEDRMLISTLISVTWALGFIIGNSVYAVQSIFEKSMSSVEAFQTTVGVFAIVAFVFMMIPVLFLKEKKYAKQGESSNDTFSSIRTVFKNPNFKYFTISDLMYWLALTFIQAGASYYIIVLMGLDKEYASGFMMIGFFVSFLLYIPINWMVKRFGKKQTLVIAFLVFSLVFAWTFLISYLALPTMFTFYTLAILSAFPLAAFGIIPNAIIADIVHEHEQQTGESQAGMFYAARNFMMKLGISIANLIFPSLLLLGKSTEHPLGVQMSALLASVFCIVGYLVFTRYKATASHQ